MMSADKPESTADNNSTKQKTSAEIWMKRIKLILGLISFSLFLAQTVSLTKEYLLYKTVVTTNFVQPVQLVMPAVTLCAPVPIMFSKLCQQNETEDDCYQRLNDENEPYKANVIAKHINDYIANKPDVRSFINNNEYLLSLGCSIALTKKRENFSSQLTLCDGLTSTVDSLIYNTNKRSNVADYCVTYFSKFDPNYDPTKYTVKLIDFGNLMATIFMDLTYKRWFPPWYQERGIGIAIHPPNMIPSDLEWKYINIFSREAYVIRFTRTVSTLLERPFETNCFDYSADPSVGISKSDCERKCVFDASHDRRLDCVNQWNVIILSQLANHTRLCPVSADKNVQYFAVRELCQARCLPDCHQEKFSTELELFERHYNPVALGYATDEQTNITEVQIKHSNDGDTEIVHKEETTFTGFVANVGGLGGLYLGLSLVALYDSIVYSVSLARKLWTKMENKVVVISK